MNRTDRLLAIVLHLRARRYTRAEDLAAHFEVSVRTMYRDVLALCEAGVPVVATPGQGYMLQDGYFLPPVMLTPDEASALLLGASFVAAQVDAPYRVAVETARAKVEKLLPEVTRQTVETLHDSLRFIGGPATLSPVLDGYLTTIRRAIEKGDVLTLTYHARHGDPGRRDVEPHGLVFVAGRWLVAAYCRTRRAMRSFRLDRVEEIEPTGERFTRRPGFSVRRLPEMRPGTAIIAVKLAPSVVRWARENRPPTFVEEIERPDGVVMTFGPRDVQDILP